MGKANVDMQWAFYRLGPQGEGLHHCNAGLMENGWHPRTYGWRDSDDSAYWVLGMRRGSPWPARSRVMLEAIPVAEKKPKSSNGKPAPAERHIAENRKARHRFVVLETLECGLALVGSEVKSLREGKASLDEAYGRVRDGEVWLIGCDIPEYRNATLWNHESKRPRKLLLHQREVDRFAGRAKEKGLTLVPLKLYFNERGMAKVLLGLCRGKQLHDKREDLKKAAVKRDIDRAMRRKR
jgi:SsrA-binding protein